MKLILINREDLVDRLLWVDDEERNHPGLIKVQDVIKIIDEQKAIVTVDIEDRF